MSKIFGDIKSQLQGVLKIKDVNSDNVVFKLFYKATFALLIASAGNFLNIFCRYLLTPALLERIYKPHYNYQNFSHWPMEQI